VDGISPCNDAGRRGVPGVHTTSPRAAVGHVHGEASAPAARCAGCTPRAVQAARRAGRAMAATCRGRTMG
jgi:hypothetical protein